MPNPQRLELLIELRKQAHLSAGDAARYLGLYGTQSRKTVGAWERGEITPEATRRTRFLGYLWNALLLYKQPEQFLTIWGILSDEWHWEPLDEEEWRNLNSGGYSPSATYPVEDETTFPRDPNSSTRASDESRLALNSTNGPLLLRNNLPVMLTSLLGREQDLAMLARLIAQRDIRLLTLLGPGGIGKTRLLLEIGKQIAESHFWTDYTADANIVPAVNPSGGSLHPSFADGVYFVSLAGLTGVEGIVSAVGNAFDLSFRQGDQSYRQLSEYLQTKQLLLLLDNVEHLIDSSGFNLIEFVLALLKAAPGLKIITTSRARLGVQIEQLYPVDGLSYPRTADTSPVDLLRFDAVRLLLQHVQRIQPQFLLHDEDYRAVMQICCLVQGMPLAIEIAAGWISVLPPRDIAQAIGKSLGFLMSEAKDLPVRQRSIRAVFAASWQYLTTSEQMVFQKLAVFRGGFTLTAAEAVARATPKLLLSLIGKSFVQRRDTERFEIHELLRQYGMEQLAASGELLEVQASYAEYFATWAGHARQKLWGNEQSKWIKQFEVEHDNLRAGLAWGLANGIMELVLRIVLPLHTFWVWRGYTLEMDQWFDQVFALVDQSWATFEDSGIQELDDARRRQLTLYADLLLARAENLPFTAAEDFYHRSLALDQQIGPTINTIIVYDRLADGARNRGDYALAETWHRTAAVTVPTLQLTERALVNQNAFVAFEWSENALAQGNLEQCAALAQQAAMLFDQLENQRFATYARYRFALSVLYGDDPKRARPLLERCFSCFQEMGATDASSLVKSALGDLFLSMGELSDAHAAFIESIKLMPQSTRYGNLLGLAGLSNQLGNYIRAATLLGAMEKIRAEEGYVIYPVNQPQLTATLAATRAHLEDSTFEIAWSMGYQMTRDDIVEFALAE